MSAEHELSGHQAQALSLLRADGRRDIYEAADRSYWITYTGDEPVRDAPWGHGEVKEMVAAGLLVVRYPGCYTTPENLAARPNRSKG